MCHRLSSTLPSRYSDEYTKDKKFGRTRSISGRKSIATFSLLGTTPNLIAPDDRKLSRHLVQTMNIPSQHHIIIVFTGSAISLSYLSNAKNAAYCSQQELHNEISNRSSSPYVKRQQESCPTKNFKVGTTPTPSTLTKNVVT